MISVPSSPMEHHGTLVSSPKRQPSPGADASTLLIRRMRASGCLNFVSTQRVRREQNQAAFHLSSFASGRRTVKHAPPLSQLSPERLPPCAAMMLRETARPIPVPSDYVEKTDSKRLSTIT